MFHVDVGQPDQRGTARLQEQAARRPHPPGRRPLLLLPRQVYGNDEQDNPKLALAFQREVINNIIPSVGPT
jgi:hypothetical protein